MREGKEKKNTTSCIGFKMMVIQSLFGIIPLQIIRNHEYGQYPNM